MRLLVGAVPALLCMVFNVAEAGEIADRVRQASGYIINRNTEATIAALPRPQLLEVAGPCSNAPLRFETPEAREKGGWDRPGFGAELQMWAIYHFGERAGTSRQRPHCGDGEFAAKAWQSALGAPLTGALTAEQAAAFTAKVREADPRYRAEARVATGSSRITGGGRVGQPAARDESASTQASAVAPDAASAKSPEAPSVEVARDVPPTAVRPVIDQLDKGNIQERVRLAYDRPGFPVKVFGAVRLRETDSIAQEYGAKGPRVVWSIGAGFTGKPADGRGTRPGVAQVFVLAYDTQADADDFFSRVHARQSQFGVRLLDLDRPHALAAWHARKGSASEALASAVVLAQACKTVVLAFHTTPPGDRGVAGIAPALQQEFLLDECAPRRPSKKIEASSRIDQLAQSLDRFLGTVGVPTVPWQKGTVRMSTAVTTTSFPVATDDRSTTSYLYARPFRGNRLALRASFGDPETLGALEMYAYGGATEAIVSATDYMNFVFNPSAEAGEFSYWSLGNPAKPKFTGVIRRCDVLAHVILESRDGVSKEDLRDAGRAYLKKVGAALEPVACK